MNWPTSTNDQIEYMRGMLEGHAYVITLLMAASPSVRDFVRSIDLGRLNAQLLTSKSSDQHLEGLQEVIRMFQAGFPTQ